MSWNCLIIDDIDPILMDMLHAAGIWTAYRPEISIEEFKILLPEYQGLVVRSKIYLDAGLIDLGLGLRFIARAGAGLDLIDVDYARQRGIAVFHAARANRDAVGEHAMGLLLGVMNNLQVGHAQVSQGIWAREANRGTEILGKTVGIIGYGNMGSALARRLSGFGCRVLAYDKYVDGLRDNYAEQVGLEAFFEQVDVVSLHLPLTAETRQMADYEFFSKFHKKIWLINTARGEIVVLKDLCRLLMEGKILGAGLDVLENEKPYTFNAEYNSLIAALYQTGKVYFSPHVAGWSVESYHKIGLELATQILQYHQNQ